MFPEGEEKLSLRKYKRFFKSGFFKGISFFGEVGKCSRLLQTTLLKYHKAADALYS